ncbi:MAG: hypothetical protein IK124_11350 [Prevotella sp.]|nr:hypothetical protein [Prevotella sp.]MBR6945953.1 hypothetical protein [Prevotella sp.]
MKRYFNILVLMLVAVCGTTMMTGCSDDEWGNDNPEYKNVFIVAFADWGPKSNNDKTYTVNQGSQVTVPVQLWCEGTRGFNADAYVYVDSSLKLGTDYQIVDGNGAVLQQNANGAFVLTWDLISPDYTDNHRVQNLQVKALNGAKGNVTLMTFDPKDVDEAGKLRISNGGTKDDDTQYYVPNNKTDQYEVRCLTVNYKVVISIK